VSKLSDKQMLLAVVLVPVLLVGGVGYLAWTDWQKVHAAEITDDHPEAAEITEPERWGERRKCQEIQKEMAKLREEADLIAKREQDVIVYREIVERDSQILPDKDLVNQLTNTINDFERQSGVTVTSVADLNVKGDANQAIRKLPIKLSLQGSFDQFLRFLNLFETMDRIVNTRMFSISRGSTAAQDGPAAHTISLELETYVYNPGAGLAKPVEIQNYERRKDDPVIQKLVKQQKAARVEKYQLKPRINRRDPLVDPRKGQVGPDEGAVSQEKYEEQRRVVERLRHEVETLKEDVRLEQQYLQEKKYLQYVQIKALNDERVQSLDASLKDADAKVTVAELREQFADEVVTPFTRLAGDRRTKGENQMQFVLRQHVSEFLEKMRAATEAREYEKSLATHREFENFLTAGNRKLAEDAQPLVAEMRELARECTVMIEFTAMKLTVAGLIRRPQGSTVILNGKLRKPGDLVDEKGRCRLVAIREDALVFDLDGYEITHSLDRK
jgi:Tfp pilus assembly protein PilO